VITATPSKTFKEAQRRSKAQRPSKEFKEAQRPLRGSKGPYERGREKNERFFDCCRNTTPVAKIQHFWGVA